MTSQSSPASSAPDKPDASTGGQSGATGGPDLHDPAVHESLRRYWRTNIIIMSSLLAVWAIVSLGCGVLFADVLNAYRLGGIPLGFWFAQQGSIMVFVVLILIYCVLMNRLDRKHHAELEQLRNQRKG